MHRLALTGLLLFCLLPGCGDDFQEQGANKATQELAQCREQIMALQTELEEARGLLERQSAQQPADKQLQARIKQLEYTLNRAYIDIKAALMEKERQIKRAQKLERENQGLREKLQQAGD